MHQECVMELQLVHGAPLSNFLLLYAYPVHNLYRS